MAETLTPPTPHTLYGSNLEQAQQNYNNGLYANRWNATADEMPEFDQSFDLNLVDNQQPVEGQTSRESVFYKTGISVGRLIMKGSVLIDSIKTKNISSKLFTPEDLEVDMFNLRSELGLKNDKEEYVETNSVNRFSEYIESDHFELVKAPKMSDIDTSDRDLSVKTQSGEELTEAEYVTHFMEDMAGNLEFRDKLQWIGEKELVYALAEQTKWLVGRVMAGDSVLIVGESWNRKNVKSGDYISKLIVEAARKTFEAEGIDNTGKIITENDLNEGNNVDVDRAVMFDDWIVSGHDMGYRARWTTRMLKEYGISQDKLSINLLAAQNDLLSDGFDGFSDLLDNSPNIPVLAPIQIEGNRGVNGGLFSGIHSDADYSFTNRPEMQKAIEHRTPTQSGQSSYLISSIDTFGSADFYNRLEAKLQNSLVDPEISNAK